MPPGAHPNFQAMHTNAAMAAAYARQHQMRQVSNPGMASTSLNQMTPYQPQLHAALHPQQLQQLQHFQQTNPGLRMNPQPQMIPQHLLQQQQALANAAQLQAMAGQQGQQPVVPQRYINH